MNGGIALEDYHPSQDCDASIAEDRSLPYTVFLVHYHDGESQKFDIASSAKQVDIFDYYWDLYRNDFVTMTQSEGRVNPKLWQDPNKKEKKK